MTEQADVPPLADDPRTLMDMVAHAPVGIARVAADGSLLWVNDAFSEIAGYSRDELLQRTFQEITHPDDVAADLALAAKLAGGAIGRFSMEKRYVRKDGSVVWVELTASAVRDENGSLLHFIGVVADIDRRKRAEAEAEESQATLEAVLATAPVGFALFDNELRYLKINRRLADMNGLSIEEHLGRTPMELLPELRQDLYVEQFRRVLASGEPLLGAEFEATTPAAPGVPRWFREDWYPISVAGEVVALAALVVETTEDRRRSAERERLAIDAAIVDERAHAARVLAAVGDGVVALDGSGSVDFVNQAAARLLRRSPEAMLGKPLAASLEGWDAVAARVPLAEEGTPATATTLPFDIDGRELWLSVAGVRLADGAVYAFHDDTEEHRLENLRSEVVTTLSHEVRTPLTAIYGAIETLRRQDVSFAEEDGRRLLEMAAEQAQRLSSLADRIALVHQLDAATLTLDERAVDPNRVVASLVRRYAAQLPDGLELVLGEADAPPVTADERRLESALAALLENAIKYSPDGGTITVSAVERGGRVRFVVRDEGIGVARHEHARIFEKFYRADPEQTRGVGGTGLGLYIARTLVERMHGRIWVESEPGSGATFVLELPQRA